VPRGSSELLMLSRIRRQRGGLPAWPGPLLSCLPCSQVLCDSEALCVRLKECEDKAELEQLRAHAPTLNLRLMTKVLEKTEMDEVGGLDCLYMHIQYVPRTPKCSHM